MNSCKATMFNMISFLMLAGTFMSLHIQDWDDKCDPKELADQGK